MTICCSMLKAKEPVDGHQVFFRNSVTLEHLADKPSVNAISQLLPRLNTLHF